MVTSSAAILKEARRSSQLTQTELAVRARVTQSVISAYESGRREPALSTLTKLVEAAGFQVNVGLERSIIPTPDFMELLHRHKKQILRLCSDAGVSNMRIFGSVARGSATQDSDIDLLVDISPELGLLGLMQLERDLHELLGVKIDLVPSEGLKAHMKEEIMNEAIPFG